MPEVRFRGLDDYLFVEIAITTITELIESTTISCSTNDNLAGFFRLSQPRPISDESSRDINSHDDDNCLWSRCPKCKRPMQEPRLLDCLHPICSNCVEASRTVGGSLGCSWLHEEEGCPICDHPLPSADSPPPPPHYPLQHRLLMNAVFTRQILCYCDTCKDQVQASLHCSTCLRNFCQSCGSKHHRARSKSGGVHEIWPLWRAKRFRRTTVCLEHPEHPLRFYCIACQQIACSECMWRGEHRGHASEDHITAGKNAAEALANTLQSAKSLLESLLVRYTASSFSSSRSGRSHCSTQTRCKDLPEESLYTREARQRIEEFSRLRCARNLIDAVSLTEQLLSEGSDAEILSLSRVILKRFHALGLNIQPNGLVNNNTHQGARHFGIFHCCTFCSSGGKKEATCACRGTMPGGYKGCGHGHPGHPRAKHWSCCASSDYNSVCPQYRTHRPVYRFTL